jgi:hypothetical protein
VSDFFGTYEENNLTFYAGTQFENFMLFKHPHKFEAKQAIEDLPKQVQSPFKVMKLWMKWEMSDINAMMESIEAKSELEGKRFSILQRR